MIRERKHYFIALDSVQKLQKKRKLLEKRIKQINTISPHEYTLSQVKYFYMLQKMGASGTRKYNYESDWNEFCVKYFVAKHLFDKKSKSRLPIKPEEEAQRIERIKHIVSGYLDELIAADMI